MKRSEINFVLKAFAIWLLVLFAVIFFVPKFLPLQNNFIGGGIKNYLANPFLWAWSNFDGEHYLAIAQNGYQPLTYFFFPLYPILIKYISLPLGNSLTVLVRSGIFISFLSFLIGLYGLYKLAKLDFNEFASKYSVVLILLFPTSFFFGSVYTESLFFALTVWCFYFARRQNWLVAGILGALVTATRLVGLAVVAAIIIEAVEFYRKDKKIPLKIFGLGLSILGIATYMFYLWKVTGDPLNFLHTVGIFGAQRSSSFITLPQVLYRYIFKILPVLNYQYFPVVFSTWLEFILSLLFTVLSVYSFVKLRLSYSVFLALGYIIPTLSGSFSSMPRYVLVLFPAYILLSLILTKNKRFLIAFSIASTILLVISFAFFARGYWIS